MGLRLEHVTYQYSTGTAYEIKALDDVNLEIKDGQFLGIIGHTGSGKSTLVQHLNGLLKATSGTIYFNDENIYADGYDLKGLRTKVGMVFQYPEHQLFETTVFADVCFGPKNQGLPEEEIKKRAEEALEAVGFPKAQYDASPFELSGGQKRRVAIAGVLAMHPQILILDEPTAGLDPAGRNEILDLIKSLHDKKGDTIVLVSHSMEDVANYVDRILVMDKGRPRYDGTPREVFRHYKDLEEIGLAAPEVTYVMHDLKKAGFPVDVDCTTVEEAREEILRVFRAKQAENN
jgi:energy-coupling factor transporter ATPase